MLMFYIKKLLNNYSYIFYKYSMLSCIILFNLFMITYFSLFLFDLFMIWFTLEITNFMFIYMMNMFMNNKKMIFLYFIIQIITSFLIMFTIIINNIFMIKNYTHLILNLTLMIKLSIPPFHFWLPMISKYLPWDILTFMITIQKTIPFYMMSMTKFNNFFMLYIMLILSSVIPPIMTLNLTNFKMIMSYSSINQSSWMLMLIYMKTIVWFKYLIIYSLTTMSTVFIFHYFKMFKNSSFINNTNFNMLFLLMMFNMAGLPPFTMFYLKWYSIFLFMKLNNLMFMLIMMMSSSLFMLYIYNTMLSNSVFFFKMESKLLKYSHSSNNNTFPYLLIPMMFISSLFIMI